MLLNFSASPPLESGEISSSRVLLHDVFDYYRRRFWQWFSITAPTSIMAAIVLLIADEWIRETYRYIPWDVIQWYKVWHWGAFAEAFIFRFGSFFLAWLLGAFSLGAIATRISNIDDSEGSWRTDSHQRAREHFSALFLVALFTFVAYWVGAGLLEFVGLAITREVGWRHFAPYYLAFLLLSLVIVGSVISWFGMAIPLVVRGDIGAWAALRKSIQISNGYEGLLFLLVIESLVGSYLGWYATHYGLQLVVPVAFRHTSWYGWLAYFVSVLASAAVQPPMFIGFSLLADRALSPALSFPSTQESP